MVTIMVTIISDIHILVHTLSLHAVQPFGLKI